MTRLYQRLNVLAAVVLSSCLFPIFAAEYAQVGAFLRDGAWEIGIVFDGSVNRFTATSAGNYILPSEAQLQAIRQMPENNSVILTVSGLVTNSNYSITLTNILNTAGTKLPPATFDFGTKAVSWVAIGRQESGVSPSAVAVGTNGFDLTSGGVEMWSSYDESTFAYEQITGDFDKRVRVVSQEGSSEEARAGLMVREFLDANKIRPTDPTDPAQAFSRYLQVQVNPVTTSFTDFEGKPVPGRNQYQINVRYTPGGATENPSISDNVAPPYPNAWLRLKRVGQTFHAFRGDDGTNWVRLGSFTFPTNDFDGNAIAPFANSVFIGPNYSPETANIPINLGTGRAFLAQFRDFSEASGDVDFDPPQLNVSHTGAQVEITWSGGTLEGTSNLSSPVWSPLGTSSPLKITPTERYQFFRARNP